MATTTDFVLVLGKGFSLQMDGLKLFVEVGLEGWGFAVYRIKDKRFLVRKQPASLPAHDAPYPNEAENCMFEAILRAFAYLGRDGDDPHEFFARSKWQPYGPGHVRPEQEN